MIATPDGHISRYFYGIDYSPKDLKFGIMESAEEKIGNPAEQLLLYCYHYDPATGKYGFSILQGLRRWRVRDIIGIGAMDLFFGVKERKEIPKTRNLDVTGSWNYQMKVQIYQNR